MVNGGAVSWRSCKKSSVAQSTMELEYMAITDAVNEAIWLRKFVIKLGVFPSMRDPMTIFCDNAGAITNTKEPRAHSTVKHILWSYHVIRDYVKDGDVKIYKVHTDLNVVDPFMKPIPRAKFDQYRESIGVRSLPNVN
jgi:hypothetical protein